METKQDRRAKYQNLYTMARNRVLAAMAAHDEALGSNYGLQYAHNWYRCTDSDKGRAITALLERFESLSSALWRRETVEYYRWELPRESVRYGRNAALERAAQSATSEYKAAREDWARRSAAVTS